MKINILSDLVLNVAAPLMVGLLFYELTCFFSMPHIITSHLADGLWAYSFISFMLIVWERKIMPLWIAAVFATSICFELLQYYRLVQGAADICDIVSYFLFFSIALFTNKYFKEIFKLNL